MERKRGKEKKEGRERERERKQFLSRGKVLQEVKERKSGTTEAMEYGKAHVRRDLSVTLHRSETRLSSVIHPTGDVPVHKVEKDRQWSDIAPDWATRWEFAQVLIRENT